MKTDINGCSTCERGTESYEEFYSNVVRGVRVQYDYRTPEGKLFSTVGKSLDICRQKRDAWLVKAA